jgi:hypothetical protein
MLAIGRKYLHSAKVSKCNPDCNCVKKPSSLVQCTHRALNESARSYLAAWDQRKLLPVHSFGLYQRVLTDSLKKGRHPQKRARSKELGENASNSCVFYGPISGRLVNIKLSQTEMAPVPAFFPGNHNEINHTVP